MFAVFGEVWTAFGMILVAARDAFNGDPLTWEVIPNRLNAIGAVLMMTWASSWFFATAVLAWEDAVDVQMANRQRRLKANQISSEDIRALRRSRM